MKFQTHYKNRPSAELRFEKKTDLPSETIPDQSLTVQELFRRNAKGLPLGGQRNVEYDSDEDGEIDFDSYIPDTKNMDLADRQEFMENAKLHLEEVKKKLNALANAREKQRKLREAEFQELKQLKEKHATQGGQSTQPQKTADS